MTFHEASYQQGLRIVIDFAVSWTVEISAAMTDKKHVKVYEPGPDATDSLPTVHAIEWAFRMVKLTFISRHRDTMYHHRKTAKLVLAFWPLS
eukprot:scaffold383668_cov17-Prasinocladus_malaysianus.AAC.1